MSNKKIQDKNENEITNTDKIINFKFFKKPDNLQIVLFSAKMLVLRTIIFCKMKWQKLASTAIKTDGKRHFFAMFLIGLCDFIATTPFSVVLILPLTFGTLLYVLDKRKKYSVKNQLFTIFAFLFGHFTSIFWWFVVPLTTDFLHFFWLTPLALFGLPCIIALCFIPFFAVGLKIWQKVLYDDNSISTNYKNNNNKKKWLLKLTATISSLFNKLPTKPKKIIKQWLGEKINKKWLEDIAFFAIFLLCWYCGDYVRGHIIFGGFPWMLFGHFIVYPFAFQSVKFLGIDTFSILVLALVLTPYFLFFKRGNKWLQNISLAVIGAFAVNCIIGAIILLTTPTEKRLPNIIGSQANHKADLTMTDNAIDILNKNIKIISWFSHLTKDTILLMPESAINFPLVSGDTITTKLGKIVPNEGSLLLSGGIHYEDNKYYNVIYSINRAGHIIDMYKKQNLVPFGEYIPPRVLMPNVINKITGGMADFATDGENDLFVFYRNLPIIYPIVCYESIFPDYVKSNIEKSRNSISKLGKEFFEQNEIKDFKTRGELIVNLTNDAWLKWSVAPYQHFLMTRFLAVSTSLPVARLSNNGISAFIDKRGRIITKTKLNQADLLFVQGQN